MQILRDTIRFYHDHETFQSQHDLTRLIIDYSCSAQTFSEHRYRYLLVRCPRVEHAGRPAKCRTNPRAIQQVSRHAPGGGVVVASFIFLLSCFVESSQKFDANCYCCIVTTPTFQQSTVTINLSLHFSGAIRNRRVSDPNSMANDELATTSACANNHHHRQQAWEQERQQLHSIPPFISHCISFCRLRSGIRELHTLG